MIERKGLVIVVAGPSGGGKTTLCHLMTERLADIAFSVSHTTRAPRAHERDGHDYYFVSDAEFQTLVQQNAFVEWATVHGHCYGTSRQEVERRIQSGIDVLLDIDVQGAEQVQQRLNSTTLIFIAPPSLAILEQRLRQRHTDTPEQITRRLQAAAAEVRAAVFFSYWIINDDLSHAAMLLEHIILSERMRHLDKNQLMQHVLQEEHKHS